MKHRIWMVLAVIVAVALTAATPVLAQEEEGGPTHLFGVVFFDANNNGVWDPGEAPAPNVTVMLESADGQTEIELTSAPEADELDAEEGNVCDPLASDIPCAGTWGIVPAGGEDFWWQVTVVPPEGVTVTSENPQWVQAQTEGSEELVQFGLSPTGAGGVPAQQEGEEPLLPATGGPAYELIAAGLLFVSGAGLMLKSRRRK